MIVKMSKQYTTSTAALKATTADIFKLDSNVIDSKKIKLNGTDITELMGGNYVFKDSRENPKVYDIVKTSVTVNEETGEVFVGSPWLDGVMNVENMGDNTPSEMAWLNYYGWGAQFDLKLKAVHNNMCYNNYYESEGSIRYLDDDYVCQINTEDLTFAPAIFVSDDSNIPFVVSSSFDNLENASFFCGGLMVDGNTYLNINSSFKNLKSLSLNTPFINEASFIAGSFIGTYFTNKTFNIDMPSLTCGDFGFFQSNLEAFDSDIKNIRSGSYMFTNSSLHSFSSDMPNLLFAPIMFAETNLKNFKSNLCSLVNGTYMFSGCQLSSESIMYILYSIRDIQSDINNATIIDNEEYFDDNTFLAELLRGKEGFVVCENNGYKRMKYVFDWTSDKTSAMLCNLLFSHDISLSGTMIMEHLGFDYITFGDLGEIGIDCTQETADAFAQEVGFDTIDDLTQAFADKGWTVYWQFNGESATYDLRGKSTPAPIWAKLEEIKEVEIPEKMRNFLKISEEKKVSKPYKYVSIEDPTKHYNLNWFSSGKSTDGYQQFDSLEAAMEAFGIKEK